MEVRNVTVKYLKRDPRNGNWLYRRVVPKVLKSWVNQGEWVISLGKTQSEALTNYGTHHQRYEHMIALAKMGVTGLSPAEQRARLKAMLEVWGADPHSAGRDDEERTWREEAAAKITDRYQDPVTGEYEGVPEEEALKAKALLGGVQTKAPEMTFRDAVKLYLEENAKEIPEKLKKQVQRYRRAEKSFLAILGGDRPLSQITKADARAWRDKRFADGVTKETVRRERNDLSAVIGFALSEGDVTGSNPFSGMKKLETKSTGQNDRFSLPNEVIAGVYERLEKETTKRDLLQIWTLLDFTGARPSEIRELLVGEFNLDHPIPHIVIQEREDRELKTEWSNRCVPLVGEGLRIAQELVQGVNDLAAPAFPRFFETSKMDNLSTALNRRIRKYTDNPKHVTYGLRHNMADRLRRAETYEPTKKAIQGHRIEKGDAGRYGGEMGLDLKRDALLKALKGHREAPEGSGQF